MKLRYLVLAISVSLAACGGGEVTTKSVESQKAAAAANSIHFEENAEIDNIKKRLELTANPGLLGFVVLLNEMGQPVMYTGVKGKITSGGKRLTRVDMTEMHDHTLVRQAASDEGTYGSSGEYVYFWTPEGQYIQWNGKYLYSDKPFRLTTAPLVVNVEEKK